MCALLFCARLFHEKYKTYRYFSVFARCLHTIKTYPHFSYLSTLSVVVFCILFGSHLQRTTHANPKLPSFSIYFPHRTWMTNVRAEKESIWCKRNENICSLDWILELCIALLRGNWANQCERQQFLHSQLCDFFYFIEILWLIVTYSMCCVHCCCLPM